MKQVKQLLIVLFFGLIFVSCEKNKEIKQFATDFAAAVQSGNKSEITKMYPGAAAADSLVFAFDAEKAQIEELEGGGWKVVLGEGKDVIVVKNEDDGTLNIKESHGVFAVSKAQMDFATGTGLVKTDMNDAKIAEQLADTAFVAWVSAEFMKTFNEKFHISKIWDDRGNYGSDGLGGGEWFITVKNDGDFDFAGSDYKVTVTSIVQRGKVITLEGKDLFSGSEETLKTGFLDSNFYFSEVQSVVYEPKIKLIINLTTAELLGKYYKPKGNEYETYLKSK